MPRIFSRLKWDIGLLKKFYFYLCVGACVCVYVFVPVCERVPVEARRGCCILCSRICRRWCAELPSVDAETWLCSSAWSASVLTCCGTISPAPQSWVVKALSICVHCVCAGAHMYMSQGTTSAVIPPVLSVLVFDTWSLPLHEIMSSR